MGTSSLIRAEHNSLNLSSLAGIVETVRDLREAGYNAVVVSSGAVGVGCQRLGLKTRPTELAKKQALAAVGQVHLMRYYDDLFSALGLVRAGPCCPAGRGPPPCAAATLRTIWGKNWGWLDQVERPSPHSAQQQQQQQQQQQPTAPPAPAPLCRSAPRCC